MHLHEVLKEVGKRSGKELKEYLQSVNKQKFMLDFAWIFVNKPTWLLPEGVPPYEVLDLTVYKPTQLNKMTTQLPLFIEGKGDTLKKLKREMLFIRFLSKIHPEDAKIYLELKDGTFKCPKLTKKMLISANLIK